MGERTILENRSAGDLGVAKLSGGIPGVVPPVWFPETGNLFTGG